MSVESGGPGPPEMEVMEAGVSFEEKRDKNEGEIEGDLSKDDKVKELYLPTDVGPFEIYMESKGQGQGIGQLHAMSVGKLINKYHPMIQKDVVEITKMGKNRLRLKFRNGSAANTLVLSDELKKDKFECFIPSYLLKRKGVIKNVDLTLSDEEIVNESLFNQGRNIKLIAAKRFIRKYKNEKGEYETKPTFSVLLTFRGQVMPEYVFIHHVRCLVEPYISRVVQCYNCLRFGHMSNQCRSKIRCSLCGEQHDRKDCEKKEDLKCIHCNGNHSATDKKCTEQLRQTKIKTIMALENLSYSDAKMRFKNSYAKITDAPPVIYSKREFPPLTLNPNLNSITPQTEPAQPIKRARQISPPKPQFSQKEIESFLIRSTPSKNTPGGLVNFNPYRPEENYIETIRTKDWVCEIIMSVLDSIYPLITSQVREEELIKIIQERVSHFPFK